MREHPKVLLLLRHKNFYLAMFTNADVLSIVREVIETSIPTHPISPRQVERIRRRAKAGGVETLIVDSVDEVRHCAAMGWCEPPPGGW